MRDSRNVTAVCDDPVEITDEQVDGARLAVCDFVGRALPEDERVEAARELMEALGIAPGQEQDTKRSSLPATVPHSATIPSGSLRGAHLR